MVVVTSKSPEPSGRNGPLGIHDPAATDMSHPKSTAPASPSMMTFLFTVAEKPKGWDEAHPMLRGSMEMQRFSNPIHLGVVAAPDVVEAYEIVLEDLRPTFADHPSPLEVRLEPMDPPASVRAGIWRRHRPMDMDITWTEAD